MNIQEKILLEKHATDFNNEPKGPTLDLFFHEISVEETVAKTVFYKVVGLLLFLLTLILYIPLAIMIKLADKGPVMVKRRCIGVNGNPFDMYLFRLHKYGFSDEYHLFGKILKYTKLAYLPSSINLLKGEMRLVGPTPYSKEYSNHWNEKLTEFYKRFAIRPGLIEVYNHYDETMNTEEVSYKLAREFDYLKWPTLKNDVRIIKERLKGN